MPVCPSWSLTPDADDIHLPVLRQGYQCAYAGWCFLALWHQYILREIRNLRPPDELLA
jgi:hypothetical protein